MWKMQALIFLMTSTSFATHFQLKMPNAKNVALRLDAAPKPVAMSKDADGIWRVNVASLEPNYYSYKFDVDGTEILDPSNNAIQDSFFLPSSMILVPGNKMWEPGNVAHGVVHQHTYESQILGAQSEYYVYTPPGYSSTAKQRYPVLYLLHGFSDTAIAWTSVGKAHLILDNLIAQKKAKPMIVVMPLGYGTMDALKYGWGVWDKAPEIYKKNKDQFPQILFSEIITAVKKQYLISNKREHHAIAGLSMGGAASLSIGLEQPEDFAYVGAFSSGISDSDDFAKMFPGVDAKRSGALNKKLNLLWIACGKDDFLFEDNQKMKSWLKDRKIRFTDITTPGSHRWSVWRQNLVEFAQLLFQK